MYFSDRIKLRAISDVLSGGIYTHTVTEKEVWADAQSAKWGEFYSALAAGKSADIVFVVNRDDYTDQTEAEYNGVLYKITRPYWSNKDPDHMYLTCTRG